MVQYKAFRSVLFICVWNCVLYVLRQRSSRAISLLTRGCRPLL